MENPQKSPIFFHPMYLVKLGLSVLGVNWKFPRLGDLVFGDSEHSWVEGLTQH